MPTLARFCVILCAPAAALGLAMACAAPSRAPSAPSRDAVAKLDAACKKECDSAACLDLADHHKHVLKDDREARSLAWFGCANCGSRPGFSGQPESLWGRCGEYGAYGE